MEKECQYCYNKATVRGMIPVQHRRVLRKKHTHEERVVYDEEIMSLYLCDVCCDAQRQTRFKEFEFNAIV